MQLHFSALLIDARMKNNATAIALVTDNPVAPKEILSGPRLPSFKRTRSVGRIPVRSNSNKLKPTKQLPRRTVSAPCKILRRDANSTESRWSSEAAPCGCRARGHRVRPFKKSICSPVSSKSPPRRPRRSLDDEVAPKIIELRASLPPQLPKRRGGEACREWKALPPQIPSRSPEQELECF